MQSGCRLVNFQNVEMITTILELQILYGLFSIYECVHAGVNMLLKVSATYWTNKDLYLEHYLTSMMKFFAKIVNGF